MLPNGFYLHFLAFVFIMFLPWTQNIKTQGNVSTLYQEQTPQNSTLLFLEELSNGT